MADTVVELSTLDGTDGVRIDGVSTYANAGWTVSSAGDINGDGIDDILIGSNLATGAAYVVFGTSDGLPAVLDLAGLDGTNGFRLDSNLFSIIGRRVASAGDFNGDGIDDLIVGSYDEGRVHVLFGRADGFSAVVDLTTLSGSDGFTMFGHGVGVTGLGDINGDGLDDILVGAPMTEYGDHGYFSAGYVVFGTTAPMPANFFLENLDGSDGFIFRGVEGDYAGFNVSAGDINGDGVNDIILSAEMASNGGERKGSVYVIYGKTGSAAFGAVLDLTVLDGDQGFRIDGPGAGSYFGRAVSSAGDINGDGYDDIIVGGLINVAGVERSGATIIFGGPSLPATIAVGDVDGSNGFFMPSTSVGLGGLGVAVAGAGDLNGDGIDDFVVGRQSPTTDGEVYVVYGRTTGFDASLDLSTLASDEGFQVNGVHHYDAAGEALSLRGDFNGDGVIDLLIGANSLDVGAINLAGGAFIIYGTADRVGAAGNETLTGTAGDDVLNGMDGADKLVGLAGADTLNGGRGNDRLDGGDGDDVLLGRAGNDYLDGGTGADDMSGGTGNDVYIVDNARDTTTENGGEGYDIVRSSVSWTLGANIEGLQLQGSANLSGTGNGLANNIVGNSGNNLLHGGDGVDTVDGGDGNDFVYGDAGGDHLSGGTGNDTVDGGEGNDTLDGGDGSDKLYGGTGNDSLVGGAGADVLYGGADNDVLGGGDGNDTLDGGTGNDTMSGGAGNDVFIVDSQFDTTTEAANEGYDIVRSSVSWTLGANIEGLQLQGAGNLNGTGNSLANNILGNAGNNTLSGGAGVDTIDGGDGNDRIIGGTGNDLMTGGLGADTFVVLQESVGNPVLEVDVIHDFSTAQGDTLDLSAIDADSGAAGDQAFTLVGAFTHVAGQMTLSFSGGETLLRLDVNGDGVADYQLKINGDVTGDSGGWLL